MPELKAHLFGRFSFTSAEDVTQALDSTKTQELLAYLLVHWDRAIARDSLAELLWKDSSAGTSRKYLRQSLWQLQAGLDTRGGSRANPLVLAETNWIQLNSTADAWVDVRAFEQLAATSHGVAGSNLTAEQGAALETAVGLYQGDLLEGWYQDWCLFERERLQLAYLSVLDKLVEYAEARRDYESAIAFGERILRKDRAHERAHRRLMRLHYLAGDRSAALRQFDRCAAALEEELDAAPSAETRALREQIRRGESDLTTWSTSLDLTPSRDSLGSLRHLRTMVADLQRVLEREIQLLEQSAQPEQ